MFQENLKANEKAACAAETINIDHYIPKLREAINKGDKDEIYDIICSLEISTHNIYDAIKEY